MEEIYLEYSYQKEFEAEVKEVKDGKFIVLDQTLFYPKSGGQPNDTGKLIVGEEKYDVVFCGKFDGNISHEVDREGLKVGDKVKGVIDWDRRYKLMRVHSAAHVLSAVIYNETGALITGGQLDLEKARLDLNLENFDKEKLNDYIAKTNEYIEKDVPIKTYWVTREELDSKPELVKLAKGFPESIKNIRIVEIEGVDAQPDGGTHVKSLKEIGKVEFIKAENKGKNNRRVYYKVID